MEQYLEFTFYLNTNFGIMANMPTRWWDREENRCECIEKNGFVSIFVFGHKDIVLEWLFNLAQDGRYKLVFPDQLNKKS